MHLNAAVCCIVVVALLLLRGVVQLLPQLESSDMNATLNLHQQALSYDLLVSKEYKIWLDGALFVLKSATLQNVQNLLSADANMRIF